MLESVQVPHVAVPLRGTWVLNGNKERYPWKGVEVRLRPREEVEGSERRCKVEFRVNSKRGSGCQGKGFAWDTARATIAELIRSKKFHLIGDRGRASQWAPVRGLGSR